MKTTKLYFLLLLSFISFNVLKAGNPPQVSQLMNQKDWNFIENKGQLHDDHGTALGDIKYYGHQGGINMYCRPGKLSFVFTKVEMEEENNISEATGMAASALTKTKMPKAAKVSASRADLILKGANMQAQIIASEQQAYFENYKNEYTPDLGLNNVHSYKTITYKDIYPHIDMVLHAQTGGMKYEFVVNPGGRVSDIQMQWNGLNKLQAMSDGGISYSTAFGYMQESKPVSFQSSDAISSAFAQKGHTIGFTIGKYDHAKALVIDPSLLWGTYFGGNKSDYAYCITKNSIGNVYISGTTSSSTGIASTGAFQSSISTGTDCYVAEFNSKGKLLWATYFGGDLDEQGYGIAADGSGNVYITGYTSSDKGIASAGAYQTSLSGSRDAFLARFSSSGALSFATYFGGSDYDVGFGVAMDAAGNAYLTGITFSTSGIATSGAYQTSNGVASPTYFGSGYLAKFSASGSLSWATYFGGTAEASPSGIILDAPGNIYIAGVVHGTGLATSGALSDITRKYKYGWFCS